MQKGKSVRPNGTVAVGFELVDISSRLEKGGDRATGERVVSETVVEHGGDSKRMCDFGENRDRERGHSMTRIS